MRRFDPAAATLAAALLLAAAAAQAAPVARPGAFPATARAAQFARAPIAPQAFAVQAATASDGKMDAGLRAIVDRVRTAAGAAMPARLLRADGFFAPALPFRVLDTGAEPAAEVLVRLAPGADAHALVAGGGQVVRQDGAFAILTLPVSRIEPAASSPAVEAMALSQRRSLDLDSSRVRSKAASVQAGLGGLPQAYKGTGVIVGVLDSGIDFTHQDFRKGTGATRLLGLLDFAEGAQPSGPGVECRPGQIDSATCGEIDGDGAEGHGTHVTGIAAGNGRQNAAFTGVAPEADILFVKGIRDAQSNGGFYDADIINGAGWVFDKALTLGKPAVLNLSLGGQVGPHNGTTVQEQYLSAFTGSGRIVVISAGNSGGDIIHAGVDGAGANYATAPQALLAMTSSATLIDLWGQASDAFKVGLVAYDNSFTPVWASNPIASGSNVSGNATVSSTVIAAVSIDARTTNDGYGMRNVQIQIQKNGSFNPASLFWAVYVTASGHADMWIAGGGQFAPPGFGLSYPLLEGDANMTIGSPGTALRALCIGSHVTKHSWRDSNGIFQSNDGWYPKPAVPDSVSFFSSRGPATDGRILPDFTAPGDVIVSALSKDYVSVAADHVAFGGHYQAMQGTSQAAPHVTGIVALMLQRNPYLTPENAYDILAGTAIATDTPVPSNAYGAGRVDALAAVLATPDPLGCTTLLPSGLVVPCAEAANQPLALMAYPNPSAQQVRLAFTLPQVQRVHVALYDVAGRRVRTLWDGRLAAGPQSLGWSGDDDRGGAVPSGVYFARVISASGTRSIRIVLDR